MKGQKICDGKPVTKNDKFIKFFTPWFVINQDGFFKPLVEKIRIFEIGIFITHSFECVSSEFKISTVINIIFFILYSSLLKKICIYHIKYIF